LKERHVQTTQELKELLQMDDLSSLTSLLERMTIFVKDRYYLKSLEKDELTSARNKLLELMLQSEGPFIKTELVETVKQQLVEQNFEVTDKDI